MSLASESGSDMRRYGRTPESSPPHLPRELLVGLAMRIVHGGNDEILEHLHFILRDDLGIDLERLDLLRSVDHDRHRHHLRMPRF